jgi:modulator of FtsH protease
LFGATMALVAATAGCFALGAYAGRYLSTGLAICAYVAAFCCLFALRFAARGHVAASLVLLAVLGLLLGAGLAPTVAYSAADPRVLWCAGGAAALCSAACAAGDYLRDPGLPPLGRLLLAEVLGICACGAAVVLERTPRGSLVDAGISPPR